MLALGCGGAGELHPFASGPGSGSGSADGGPGPTASTASGGTAGSGSGTSGGVAATPIVYVRCPRTTGSVEISGQVVLGGQAQMKSRTLEHPDIYDALPDVALPRSGFSAPCDLVLRGADGQRSVLYDCASTSTAADACAALGPAVSFDGQSVAFAVFRGSLVRQTKPFPAALLDPAAENADQYSVMLPNRYLAATGAHLAVVDLAAGAVETQPFVDGQWSFAPTWLSNGRLAFVSDRDAVFGPVLGTLDHDRVLRLYTMAPDGSDVQAIGLQGMAGQRAPFQLADGRLAYSSWELLGLLPYRATNGSPGGFGTVGNYVHLYATGPDGSAQHALYGQHTLDLGGGGPSHLAAHHVGQSADGRIWVADYHRGQFGIGTVFGFPPPDPGREGVGPAADPPAADLYRPEGFVSATPWASGSNTFAGPMPDPPLAIPGYADPLAMVGKVGHPAGLPDGNLLVTWGKGACGQVAVPHPSLFGDPPPPLTSGSGNMVEINALTVLGLDNPGCDLGVYTMTALPSAHPSDLEAIVDRPDDHELMAVPAVPYQEIHGVQAPVDIPAANVAAAGDPDLPPGTPFAILGASSVLLRETRTLGGQPFEGERQWALQGTDALDYVDDDVCGVRVLAVMPNAEADGDTMGVPVGVRVSVLGELPVRNFGPGDAPLFDALGMPDTSFRVRIPAGVPYLLQAIDCRGRTLNGEQVPQHLRPGEDRVCDGCHRSGGPGLDFGPTHAGTTASLTAQLGEGTVPLLAGGAPPATTITEIDGFGVQYEHERDVLPIFEAHCVSCHSGAGAAAGLQLDLPGRDDGSTWWRLVQDSAQVYVPAGLRHQGTDAQGRLRKPQLTKYVRFMDARGSLLYWKAANARTDGRTDDQYGDDRPSPAWNDVDFGADHPTDITPEELGILSRWIDTGAAAGDGFLQDTLPPTLSVAADPGGGAVGRVHVGTVDVGTGIDPATLEVCVLSGDTCGPDLAGDADPAGVVTVNLGAPLDDPSAEIRVRVQDLAGNATELRRTVSWLAGGGAGIGPGRPAHAEALATNDAPRSATGCALAPERIPWPGSVVLLVLLAGPRRRRPRGSRTVRPCF